MAHVDHFEATRSRLLRLAGDLFARRGYAGVSMRDVAVAAGVTKPALYYHFRDKDALFTECLLTQQGALGRLVDAAIASPAAIEDRVSSVAEILLASAGEHPAGARTAADSLPAEARDRVDAGYATSVIAPIVHLFEELVADGGLRDGITPDLAAAALVGVCTGAPPVPWTAPPPAVNGSGAASGATGGHSELARLVARLVLHGVAA